ncbi:conserved repeat protein [Desulfosporosinus orientis DSM 765]|uniref:Conserved repeat protein n=1 Tax=Desulfosporosinus orientis (strain ATCC 19365 / DSM 765 / NCIMB 8382 / VKM B-1628 / Singapore I) TaxID=768706 RepID=G7W941_DESOD|nr:leucine-rich repeat protein [Desulfosporosinus orientis]AET68682.1 conserved repeat protein [Desulfosporosinus orientis DSM 765]
MKKTAFITLKSIFLILITVLIFQVKPQTALALTSGDYLYTVTGTNATITKYTGSGGNVTIPATLDVYTVTSIGYKTFNECSNLTSVTIPSSVTSIGDQAFNECSSLTSVNIPSSVTSIGSNAFSWCSSLTSVTIPSSVISIGEEAFSSSSLTSVTIPSSVTSIGKYAFASCSSLISVTFSGPSSVTSIGWGAFLDCSSLTSVTIPSSVTSIGVWAFRRCSSLTSVTIPTSVTSIGWGAFYECSSLTSVTIPSSVTSIGDQTFYKCSSLTSVTIPSSVTSIRWCAFYECSSLASVKFLGNAPTMGSTVFYNCASGFKVYYLAGKKGFTNPWYGYPTEPFGIATYTVTYNGNGSTGGTAPIDSRTYLVNEEVTVLGNTGFITKTGYTFSGWNTKTDGTGVSYTVGDTFNIGTTDITLYAKWTIAAPITLQSIAITTPATKLNYTVGDTLDISGLVVTGTYSDGSTKVEPITTANITGFNSTVATTDQVLTITVGAKTTTYKVQIVAAPITVSGVSLNKNVTTINVGANETLSATITPTNATNKNVSWNSSDPAIATVDSNGKVVGVSAGASVITVTTVDGRKTATCTVTVINSDASGGSSHTATLDQIVTEIMSFRGYLNPSEKASLNEARSNLLTAVQDGTLSSAADRLLTDQVVAKFQAKGVTRADAKAAIIKSLQGFQAIHYSDDNATIERALVKFKTENGKTFRTLFGDDFKEELFYGFMMATQDELQKEIKKEIKKYPSALLGLVGGSSTEIKDKLVEWLKTALHNVADPANSKYHVFDQKLADIGWNIDLLVETQRKVGAVIDPSNAAEKAVAMSVIRSQIQCKINGIICDPLTPLTLKKDDNKLKLVLSVKGIDTGGFKLAGLLAWKTDNSAIATIAEDGSSIKAGTAKGTTVITAYRMNDSQVEANELIRITVAVN